MGFITPTNGDGELVKPLMVIASAVSLSLSRSFHKGDCSGKKELLYAVVDAKMHFNLYGWSHLVRSAEMRDEVATAMRPWTILNIWWLLGSSDDVQE